VADTSGSSAPRKSLPLRSDDDVERAMALRDVMEHVVDVSKAPPPMKTKRKRRVVAVVLCVLLLAASAVSWLARPEWIWGPSGEPVSPVLDRASARMSMAVIAQRLKDVRAQTGEYPVGLEEIGESGNGIQYALVDDTTFVLSAQTALDSVVYRSNQPIEELLGRSVELLSGAGR
jgi:hypothetical protein